MRKGRKREGKEKKELEGIKEDMKNGRSESGECKKKGE